MERIHSNITQLLDALKRGALSSSELTSALAVSNQTLMRRVRESGGRVLRLGRTRRTRYALTRVIPALGTSEMNLYRIDESGRARPVGQLVSLVAEEVAWTPSGDLYVGLPPEVDDMKPQGFLGRSFPEQHRDLGLPQRLSDWSNDDIVVALARRGDDMPGNLIVGDESYERWASAVTRPIGRDDFDDVARKALAGEAVGSSAGGEQPKFGALVDGRHVLVKLAPRDTAVGRRWADLLVLEHLALETLRARGLASAATKLLETSSFRFLEIERFDRVGARGRIAVLSLWAALQEPALSWSACGRRMRDAGLLPPDDARRLALYDAFGQLIGNTDRHHHNVLLFPEHNAETSRIIRYRLAPTFDQLPMMFAPTSTGIIRTPKLSPGHRTAGVWDVWGEAVEAALELWSRASQETRLTEELRAACAHAVTAIQKSTG